MWQDVPVSCIFNVKGLGSVKSPESPLYFYGEVIFFSPLVRHKSSCGYWCGYCLKTFSLDRDMKYGFVWFLFVLFFFFFNKNRSLYWCFHLNSGYTVFYFFSLTSVSPFSHVKISVLCDYSIITDFLYPIITHKSIRIAIPIAT